ncbi:MAG: AAA family ATPase [Magnetococcales bacterium]|nr:AAA family ATPase [Magnetococcales bacterium]HIJ82984.1 AAA family ATPase [Magnetococcales bacterium]
MKISRVKLENFKRFKKIEFFVKNELTQDISDQFLILGDNGTGKTTVLQAIALTLSRISAKTASISDFDWQGWIPGRYNYKEWGSPIVELDVHFSIDEIEATQEAADLWNNNHNNPRKIPFIKPGDAKDVTVRLEGEHYFIVGGNRANIFQFRGRTYASHLVKNNINKARDLFSRLPGVFWFDQYRNMTSPQSNIDNKNHSKPGDDNALPQYHNNYQHPIGISRLRKYLNEWNLHPHANDRHNWLRQLEDSYKKVFPDRSFSIPELMYKDEIQTAENSFFCLFDGNRTYDIEEMSAGEQSVFPILYEFVQKQIRNSVVLVDEIDLNLHPPLAQALLAALPTIGPNCQFLFTTHSEAVSSIASSEETYRLPGGQLCL